MFLINSEKEKRLFYERCFDAHQQILKTKHNDNLQKELDETTSYGNLYNVKMYTGAELSYVTNGQNVPDDIEVFDTQRIVKKLLGGN